MADVNVTQPVTTEGDTAQTTHDDLLIAIYPHDETRFQGTAEQLIAEGLIPKGFKWPDGTPLMATSNSPTCGQSNSPRQDG